MSLDEINEEIREVRRLRKERNGICSHWYEHYRVLVYNQEPFFSNKKGH
jgi:uncharacterized coiled-coil DUF342 family protein